METQPVTLPLIVIVGPTASGKTGLAVDLAEKFKGEIICADSRTIYKELNIGTAKPTESDQSRVPHWGIDLIRPDEAFTAADFQRYANQKIEEIRQRGHVPFLVGGTGLYVDAVLFDYQFGEPADLTVRQQLEKLSLEELHVYCRKNNIKLPENIGNKRYVIRAIEQNGVNTSRKIDPIPNSIVVGITTDKDTLRKRIERRIEQLLQDGVVEEATILGKKYGWNVAAMTGNVYPIIRSYLLNEISERELVAKSATVDWHLAKRQVTWFKRNPHIAWYPLSEAERYLSSVLVNEQKA